MRLLVTVLAALVGAWLAVGVTVAQQPSPTATAGAVTPTATPLPTSTVAPPTRTPVPVLPPQPGDLVWAFAHEPPFHDQRVQLAFAALISPRTSAIPLE